MSIAPLRLGTRGSKLARWQADHVATLLRDCGTPVEVIEISTVGDRDQSPNLSTLPTVGVFTKEIQRPLVDAEIDLAVHSLKDLPTTPVEGLVLAAVPARESPLDALVSRSAASLAELPDGAVIGTGSLRRQAQLRSINPTWQCVPVRGNVDTRLRKLDEGQFDALLLATAGLQRLGLANRIAEPISAAQMLPAPGQGALGLECSANDQRTCELLAHLDHAESHACTVAERALLAGVEGGCLAAVGALATWNAGLLQLRAVVLDPSGRRRIDEAGEATLDAGDFDAAARLGRQLADRLIAHGARDLLIERE